jgi:type I restriction enzyme S subunit
MAALRRDIAFITSGPRGWGENYAETGSPFLRISNLTRHSINLDKSDLRFVTAPDGAEQERTRAFEGDVLFSITAYLGSVAVVPDSMTGAFVSQHIALVRLRGRLFLPQWVAYVALSDVGQHQLGSAGYGGTKVQLSLDDVAGLELPVPTLEEQRAIAAFLDRETAKIDALVAEQERLIALLKEKRQAVISHAVTKGLNPAAPMKDSGVEWLGQIPAHWEVKRVSSCAKFFQGKAHEPYVDEAGQHICVTARFVSTNGEAIKYCSENLSPGQKGDILMVMSDLPNGRALARAFLVKDERSYAVNQRVCSIRFSSGDPRFFAMQLNRNMQLLQFDDGVEQTHLTNGAFKQLLLAVPPLGEQFEIATCVSELTDRIDRLGNDAAKAIALLVERRAALISAGVTGKIDVRGLAPVIETKPAAWVRDQVGAEIISLQAHKPKFGRVKFQKQIFLAETHIGVSEIGGRYQREAAGPYDRALIASVEKNLEDAGFMTVKQAAKGAAVTYHLKSGAKPDRDSLNAALGDRAEALVAMIKLTADLDTPAIEAVATLYAVWNDLLIDGQPAPDDRIITGVLSEWHTEKAQKFTRAGLQSHLDWMRRHDLVPRGKGPKTQLGSLM